MLLAALVVVLGTPALASAQSSGHARAVQASVTSLLGTINTSLADTGTLSGAGDARDSSQGVGSIAGLLSGNTLHASTIGSGDTVASEASIGDLALSVAGNSVGAGFVMARALAATGVGSAGAVSISGLSINGVAVAVTGEKNQTLAIPGGRIVINEQQTSSNGTTVNALHIVVNGIADVVVASAAAQVQ
jgi:hypothetical protein